MEGLSKKEKGLMDMDNSVVIAGREVGIRGLNGNGKNTIKIKFFLNAKRKTKKKRMFSSNHIILDHCYLLLQYILT